MSDNKIQLRNEFFFQIDVTEEQVRFANELVEYSIKNHPVIILWVTLTHKTAITELI